MIRMLQFSLLLGRIVQRGRVAASISQASFISPRNPTQRQHNTASYHVAVAASSNPQDNSGDSDDDMKDMNGPQFQSRRGGIREIHQSPLFSIYDEMFAEEEGGDGTHKEILNNPRTPPPQQSQEDNFTDIGTLKKQMDFQLDNDFPEFPQGQGGPIDQTFSKPKPPKPPPRAQSAAQSVTAPNSSERGVRKKFAKKDSPPQKARMYNGRLMPPSVSECEYSYYDEDISSPSFVGNEIPEFHDGMLEELIEAEQGNSPSSKNKNEQASITDDVDKDKIPSATLQDIIETSNINERASKSPEVATSSELKENLNPTKFENEAEVKPKKSWVSQTKPPIRPTAQASISPESLAIFKASSDGTGRGNQDEIIQHQLNQVQAEIYKLNHGKEFNINSPKQVSMVLFGVDNESTNKDALEALSGNISNTGGNARIAALILRYRKYSRDLKRAMKTKENQANGIHVKDVNSMREGKNKESASGGELNQKVTPSSILANTDGEREPLVLIDASAYIFRAYYSMPAMHRYDGEPTGATLGFCNMLNKLILTPLLRGEQPRVVLVFDSKEGTNFRKKLYPEYKSNRKACPEDLIPQFDFVRDAAGAYGCLQLEAPGFEADDVIATLSRMAVEEGCHVNILSGDKDLMQLVTKDNGGACVEMIDPMKMVRFCHETVREKWGVKPHQVGDILGLAGDSSDNIPGVPGIGPKIAAALIQQFGSMEELYENLDEVKQKGRREKLRENAELARLSRQLVELERNVPMEDMSFPLHTNSVSDLRMEKLDQDRLLKFYERMGFKDLKMRVKSRLPNGGIRQTAASQVPDLYSSVSEDVATRAASQAPDLYSSVSENVATSKPTNTGGNLSRNGNGFSSPSKFKAPPSPEDYSDVPF